MLISLHRKLLLVATLVAGIAACKNSSNMSDVHDSDGASCTQQKQEVASALEALCQSLGGKTLNLENGTCNCRSDLTPFNPVTNPTACGVDPSQGSGVWTPESCIEAGGRPAGQGNASCECPVGSAAAGQDIPAGKRAAEVCGKTTTPDTAPWTPEACVEAGGEYGGDGNTACFCRGTKDSTHPIAIPFGGRAAAHCGGIQDGEAQIAAFRNLCVQKGARFDEESGNCICNSARQETFPANQADGKDCFGGATSGFDLTHVAPPAPGLSLSEGVSMMQKAYEEAKAALQTCEEQASAGQAGQANTGGTVCEQRGGKLDGQGTCRCANGFPVYKLRLEDCPAHLAKQTDACKLQNGFITHDDACRCFPDYEPLIAGAKKCAQTPPLPTGNAGGSSNTDGAGRGACAVFNVHVKKIERNNCLDNADEAACKEFLNKVRDRTDQSTLSKQKYVRGMGYKIFEGQTCDEVVANAAKPTPTPTPTPTPDKKACECGWHNNTCGIWVPGANRYLKYEAMAIDKRKYNNVKVCVQWSGNRCLRYGYTFNQKAYDLDMDKILKSCRSKCDQADWKNQCDSVKVR